MSYKFLMTALLSLILAICLFPLSGKANNEIASVLESAENLFKALKVADYTKLWNSLTAKSKEAIIRDVAKALEKFDGKQYEKVQLMDDFQKCSVNCRAYWKGYLTNFNPDTVLEQSKWDIGPIKGSTAEIYITYKRSERPAVIKMFKEDGIWKVGLTETFWSRK